MRDDFRIVQNYLDCFYPKEKRSTITRLDIFSKKLVGSLDLTEFTNLKELNCNDNQLTELILPQPNQLERILINDNLLTDFDFNKLNSNTLTHLDLGNNNLKTTNLSIFSPLVNLKELWIGSDKKEKIKQKNYNRFTGSLQFLQNCSRLNRLDISNTDLNAGVKYLPVFLRDIWYSTEARPDCQLKEIKKELEEFKINPKEYLLKKSEQTKSESKNEVEIKEEPREEQLIKIKISLSIQYKPM